MSDNTEHINLSFTGSVFELKHEITLEQVPISASSLNANLTDIFQMFSRAQSGLTAFSYVPPTMEGVRFVGQYIYIDLDFWVWPTPVNLPYSLKISGGSVSGATAAKELKSGNIVIPLKDKEQLPFTIDPAESTASWETPTYNQAGMVVNSPEINFEGQYVYFKGEVFGILRSDLTAIGYRHTATLTFQKSESGREEIAGIITNQTTYNAFNNVKCTVVCSYTDEDDKDQEETLELKIPKNVQDLLEECLNGKVKSDPRCEDKIGVPVNKIQYYYSTCTGEILDIVRSDTEEVSRKGCDSDE